MKIALVLTIILGAAGAVLAPPRSNPDPDSATPDAGSVDDAGVELEVRAVVDRADRAIQAGEDYQAVLNSLRRELTRLNVALADVERSM